MATFITMQNSVYAVLRDVGMDFVTPTQVKEWLNEGYLDLNTRAGLLQKAATGTTSATGTVALPADFIRETSFAVDDGTDGVPNSEIYLAPDEVFLSWKLHGGVPATTIGRVFDANIETYPVVVSKAYSLEYIYKPVALVADGDVPAIPEETHVKLINYARAQAKWKEGEPAEGDTYMSLYLEGLGGPPTGQYRKRPGPFGFVPTPDYWDESGV